jgi:RimJ/RimL family protein N-acetyltransferase
MTEVDAICLRPWAEGDLGLLREQNSSELMAALGGPESEEALLDRHRRYVELSTAGSGCMYVVLSGPDSVVAGSIGFWEKEWDGDGVYETGWYVRPSFRGRGVAARAAGAVVRIAAAEGDRKELHAFPPVTNAASIGVCRKAGFALRGEVDFEYPKGTWIRCADWWVPLR